VKSIIFVEFYNKLYEYYVLRTKKIFCATMIKSQLVELLKTFSKKEIRDCKKWLNSPFHNQRQDVVELFEYFFYKKYIEKEKKLEKEVVFSYLFPKQKYDDAKIRQTMYFLLKFVEEFLVYDYRTKEEITNKITLAKIYRERRHLNKYAQKATNTAYEQLEKQPHRDCEFHQSEYMIKREEMEFALEANRYGAQKFMASMEAFNLNYAANKFKDLCITQSDKDVIISKKEQQIINSLADYIADIDYTSYPAVVIFQKLYDILRYPDHDKFIELKQIVISNLRYFNSKDKWNIFLSIINYCTRQMNQGQKQYSREAFIFYKIGIEDHFFIRDGLLYRYLFRNIVSTGLNLKEFEWVEQFIDNYQTYLSDDHRENYTTFCLADLYYHRKEYDRAMQFLAAYEYDDILLNLNSRVMLIKMYYERNEVNSLEALLESSKVYIRRKKGIAKNYSIAYGNIIKYTQKLLHVNPYDKSKKNKLRAEIQAANPLIAKEWFLEKLEQL